MYFLFKFDHRKKGAASFEPPELPIGKSTLPNSDFYEIRSQRRSGADGRSALGNDCCEQLAKVQKILAAMASPPTIRKLGYQISNLFYEQNREQDA